MTVLRNDNMPEWYTKIRHQSIHFQVITITNKSWMELQHHLLPTTTKRIIIIIFIIMMMKHNDNNIE